MRYFSWIEKSKLIKIKRKNKSKNRIFLRFKKAK